MTKTIEPQWEIALREANARRSAIAQWKKDIAAQTRRAGLEELVELLERRRVPREVESLQLWRLLAAPHRCGRRFAMKVSERSGIHYLRVERMMKDTTQGERKRVAATLRHLLDNGRLGE